MHEPQWDGHATQNCARSNLGSETQRQNHQPINIVIVIMFIVIAVVVAIVVVALIIVVSSAIANALVLDILIGTLNHALA